jgi:hypothetical protein
MEATMRLRLKLIPMLLVGAVLPLTLASSSMAQTSLAEFAAAGPMPSFDTPELALERLKSVLASNDVDGLANLLGPEGRQASRQQRGDGHLRPDP